jgi:hypothetical protein
VTEAGNLDCRRPLLRGADDAAKWIASADDTPGSEQSSWLGMAAKRVLSRSPWEVARPACDVAVRSNCLLNS